MDTLPNILKQRWRQFIVDKLTLNYLATALVDMPAGSMPTPSKHETSVALCCVTKKATLKCAVIVPSTRSTCVMIMLFNQLLDMSHLSGGWIFLPKEKWALTGM